MNDIKAIDREYVAGTYARFPVQLVKGKGSLAWDENGKEYIDTLFPGYVFWETESLDGFSLVQKGRGFVKILQNNTEPLALTDEDVELIRSFLKYGTIMPIVRVTFDVNDRIQILDGIFKGQEGLIKAVNRRNKRVNFEVELMNGVRVIGLTYEIAKKADSTH